MICNETEYKSSFSIVINVRKFVSIIVMSAYRRLVELVDVRRGVQHPLQGGDQLGDHDITAGSGSGGGVVSEGADGLGSTDGCPAD
jgi:hypothetical protein